MTISDISFVPHSDMSADDTATVLAHKNLIDSNHLKEAAALLEHENYQKGYRASLFNSIEKKLQAIQLYLLNKKAMETEEMVSDMEPAPEEMGSKIFWITQY